ncbi:hypothetical protein BGZ96_005926 [Linnemannia gamsii]|uniref:Uncharacterized protein n=1 Tax=Linnemannia gamsii TaxID=64522 RepID=A0ABQ7K4X3_9FUNG|nr:hypothetical protein BGZ96_005926 [Linnemannia gamsii]
MSAQVAIYVCAFLGMTFMMGLFAGLVYRRHRMMVKQHRAYERTVQDRIQQAQDENLPPFYVDHVRDRACVFEGELPPDNSFLRTLEVVVVRPTREDTMLDLIAAGIVPPETGNTGTETGTGARTGSGNEDESEAALRPRPNLTVSEVPLLGIPVVESGSYAYPASKHTIGSDRATEPIDSESH